MKLTVTGRENGVIRLDCSGTITAFPAPEGVDMWQVALGPDGYAVHGAARPVEGRLPRFQRRQLAHYRPQTFRPGRRPLNPSFAAATLTRHRRSVKAPFDPEYRGGRDGGGGLLSQVAP